MPQITKLTSQKNQRHVNVFLDGKYSFSLFLDTIVKQGLVVGKSLTEKEIEDLLFTSLFEKIYARVLNFLSYRPRSPKEVKDYIQRKLPPAIPQSASWRIKTKILTKLEEHKLLDEKGFALWWLDQRLNFNPKGKKLLVLELKQKGIAQEIISQVLQDIDEEQLENQAKKVAQKKLKHYQNLPQVEQKQKLQGILLRRGFDWNLAKKVIDETVQK